MSADRTTRAGLRYCEQRVWLLGSLAIGEGSGKAERIQLDVRELTERVDNSIKFLTDTFSARVYRLAANPIGIPDYRTLVDQKLSTAGELYRFMLDRFHQGRAFVLEIVVVVILMIELVYLFRGRTRFPPPGAEVM